MTLDAFIAKWERVITNNEERKAVSTHLHNPCKMRTWIVAAYGWIWPMTEDEILAALLTLNLERSQLAAA